MTRPMDIAYRYIKDRILDGTYSPSQKLNESDLSSAIEVSRNTIKKSLLKLEQENLVEIEVNKGATVKSYTLDEVINYFEIREVLEILIARRATVAIKDAQLKKLENILNEMGEYLKNNKFDEYSSLNLKFHDIIYDASENKQAVEMVSIIKTQLLRYHLRTILVPGRNLESFEEHKHIFIALKARDEEAVENAISAHISNIRKTIQSHYTYLL